METTNFATTLSSSQPAPRRCKRPWIFALSFVAVSPILALACVHHIPGAGPWAADTLRSVVGTEAVARLEDAVYLVKDQVHQVTRRGDAPKSYWEVPSEVALQRETASVLSNVPVDAVLESWSPPETSIPFGEVAAQGDGRWVELGTGDSMSLKKTLIHPDPKRSWSELFVIAIDLKKAELNWVPGRREPQNEAPGSETLARLAKIPSSDFTRLLAAFNGGFKTEHGHFGAKSDGILLVSPKGHSCTIGQTKDGGLVMGTHKGLAADDELVWLRQTPPCMVEDGTMHPGLANDKNTNWGATLDGQTVIRRSAIGLTVDGETLLVGISNDTTARALAIGMQSVGAHVVAQLDVNYSYPKIVTYQEADEGTLTAESLVDGFVTHEHQYLSAEARDFFYITAR